MIHHDTHDDRPAKKKGSAEDMLWIVSGVILSLALLAVIYFGLTIYSIF